MRSSAATSLLVGAVALVALAGLAQTGRYTIRPGDNLSAIAARNGVSLQALARANGIADPDFIVAGRTLVLPGGGPSGAPASNTIVVRPGDTLAAIASRNGTTVGALAAANGLRDANLILIGQRLVVPGGPAAPVDPNAGTVTVLPGDSLASISARTGVPISTLLAANNLRTTSMLYAGGRLLLAPRNGAATGALTRCPVSGARFMDSWGFPRADTGFHEGIDLMAPRGTPVVAPVSGYVSQVVGTIGGRQFRLTGNDGTVYIGSHLNSFGKAGTVKAGTVIGYVGNTGDADGGPTHLHFEVHPGGGPAVNPYQLLVDACR